MWDAGRCSCCVVAVPSLDDGNQHQNWEERSSDGPTVHVLTREERFQAQESDSWERIVFMNIAF